MCSFFPEFSQLFYIAYVFKVKHSEAFPTTISIFQINTY